MIPKFEDWLVAQQDREDRVGALARILTAPDTAPDPAKRTRDEHKRWADIVTAIPGDVGAFNTAWQEFMRQKLAAADISA